MLKSKILQNASWVIGCKIAQSILSFIVTLLIARFLGPSNYGLINYAASVTAFLAPIAQLGLGNIQVQELVNDPDNEGKIIGTTLSMSLISAIFCMLGVLAFSFVANASENETIIINILYSIILLFQGAELLQYWFQAKYMSKYASIVTLIAFAVVTVYKIFLLIGNKNIYWFAIVNALDYIIITFLLLILYRKLGGQSLSFSKDIAKRMLLKSKYYIVANMMVIIFSQTDRIMLKLMMGDAATGFYSAAITCASLANFVYAAIIDSFRPVIFENYNISKDKFEKNLSQLYSIIIYLSVIECLVVTFLAPEIIRLIYGLDYMEAVAPLRLSVWYSTFSYIGVIRNIWILAEGRQKLLWIINLSGALMNVALNYILIPVGGISGAAFASFFTQFFANVIVSYIIPGTRPNTDLMLRGLNPKLIFEMVKSRKE